MLHRTPMLMRGSLGLLVIARMSAALPKVMETLVIGVLGPEWLVLREILPALEELPRRLCW